MWEMQILIETNDTKKEWRSIRPSGYINSCNDERTVPPYRYDYKEDAELMLKKLYPDAAVEEVRVVSV